jgi:integrase
MTVSAKVRVSGVLAGYAKAFGIKLQTQGYSTATLAVHLRVMAAAGRWLDERGLGPAALAGDELRRFLARRRRTHRRYFSMRGLAPLLSFLRGVGAIPPEPVAPARSELLGRYERYLLEERAVLPTRRDDYVARAIEFIGNRDVGELTARDVTSFAVARAGQPSLPASLTALRSLLRFLFISGETRTNLVGAVPSSPRWRQAGLPKALAPGEIRALLATCDRRTTVGSRNYAALLFMVRLGLRAGEVAALMLDDVDWKAGEFVVHGKGGTVSKLPLPADVGKAVAAYLRRPRRRPACRSMFLQLRAPFRPASAGTITSLASTAFEAAGVRPGGGHRLRHTAATQMLRKGASLTEIAQVLRHRHFDTTAIYAKVDHARLRALARPWPTPDRRGRLREMAQRWPGGFR